MDTSQGRTVRLLLLGKSGTGKSTTGNTILGQELFSTASDFGSVNTECERRAGAHGDTRIEIMDSPGLYDTAESQDEFGTIIAQAVEGMHLGPHAVLFVGRVGRFTEEEYNVYQRLKALFDENISKYMILVFTHGDILEREGRTLEQLLASPALPGNLKTVLNECGHRCLLINNMADDPGPQVYKLLEMVRQVVVLNGGSPYSYPKCSKIGEGLEEMSKRMEKFEKENLQRQKYVQELEEEIKKAKEGAEQARQQCEKLERQRVLEMREKQKQTREATELEPKLYSQLKTKYHPTEQEQKEMEELMQERRRLELEQLEPQQMHEGKQKREKEQLNQDVVELKTPGILETVANVVSYLVRKLFSLFGFK